MTISRFIHVAANSIILFFLRLRNIPLNMYVCISHIYIYMRICIYIKILIHEIIPRFGLPRSLQSDNASAFNAAVTQRVSKALGIEYHLHCSWRPQSSGKVGKANNIIKRHLRKLPQETQDNWIKVLPIALMRARTAPQKEGLTPFECIYGRPFLHTDIVIDPDTLELTNYVTQLSAFQQALTKLQELTPDAASESSKPLFEPET